jgi:hypothetical protein
LRMAAAHGIKDPDEASIAWMKFLEKIKPKWHSAKASTSFLEERQTHRRILAHKHIQRAERYWMVSKNG